MPFTARHVCKVFDDGTLTSVKGHSTIPQQEHQLQVGPGTAMHTDKAYVPLRIGCQHLSEQVMSYNGNRATSLQHCLRYSLGFALRTHAGNKPWKT